jgi:hypothetical protein
MTFAEGIRAVPSMTGPAYTPATGDMYLDGDGTVKVYASASTGWLTVSYPESLDKPEGLDLAALEPAIELLELLQWRIICVTEIMNSGEWRMIPGVALRRVEEILNGAFDPERPAGT